MPRKLNDLTVERLMGALQAGAGIALAARIINCSRQAIYRRMNLDPEFAERIAESKAIADERVQNALFKAATENHNVVAMIFWLKNRMPQEWRDRQETQGPSSDELAQAIREGRMRAQRADRAAETRMIGDASET